MPPSTRHDRDDLHIEIYVSRQPGSLSVSSYSDDDTRTLAHAIAEAEAFIAQCRAMQADIAEHGLGAREPSPPVPVNIVEIASGALADAVHKATAKSPLFSSTTLFRSLTK